METEDNIKVFGGNRLLAQSSLTQTLNYENISTGILRCKKS